jgi:hypothetical protein
LEHLSTNSSAPCRRGDGQIIGYEGEAADGNFVGRRLSQRAERKGYDEQYGMIYSSQFLCGFHDATTPEPYGWFLNHLSLGNTIAAALQRGC